MKTTSNREKAVESMLRKEEKKRNEREEFCVEDFVPADHLLRKIEEAVNFSYIYELLLIEIEISGFPVVYEHGP